MIRELEEQLDRVIETNGVLRRELEQERKTRHELQGDVDDLRDRLERSEREAAANESLTAEIAQLHEERTRTSEVIRELREHLQAAEDQAMHHAKLVDRYRAAHETTIDEVRSVETQFERAMEMVAEAAAKVVMVEEERDALAGRLRLTEEQLRSSYREQDDVLREVDESRAALDEIRRSLSNALDEPGTPG
jgi:chromosome segregation ATPase